MVRNVAASIVFMILSTSAFAAELPQWETEKNCVTLAGGAENMDQAIYDVCMTEEKRSKDMLESNYGELPADIAAHCEKEATLSVPSYATLRACIEARLN